MNLEKFYLNLTPAAARRSQQLSLPLLSFSLKKRRATVKTPIYIGFAVLTTNGLSRGQMRNFAVIRCKPSKGEDLVMV